MSTETSDLTVRRAVTVAASPQRAFTVFTEEFRRWWPLESHHIGEKDAVDVVIEPRAGGRWFERAADGEECLWGGVLVWEPPVRIVLAWQLDAEYVYDPTITAEIEVRFIGEGAATRVELEHRNLETYGPRAAEMAAGYGGPNGWTSLLEAYAGAAG